MTQPPGDPLSPGEMPPGEMPPGRMPSGEASPGEPFSGEPSPGGLGEPPHLEPPPPGYPGPQAPPQPYPIPQYTPESYPASQFPPPVPPAAYPGQPYPAQPYPGQPYPPQPYPAPPPARKRRGVLIALLVVAGLLVLCGGGGTTAWLVTRNNPGGKGQVGPAEAVNGFLTAVYQDMDATKAATYVCSAARDKAKITKKIDEIKTQNQVYDSPRYDWTTPETEQTRANEAILTATVTVSTADDQSATQKLRFVVTKNNGWWVCDVAQAG